MTRIALALLLLATPALAQETKEASCGYQAQVIRAIQEARMDRVKLRDVMKVIVASNPPWPANYSKAIPTYAPWVYDQKMRDLRKTDLGTSFEQQCLEQWELIQEQQKQLGN